MNPVQYFEFSNGYVVQLVTAYCFSLFSLRASEIIFLFLFLLVNVLVFLNMYYNLYLIIFLMKRINASLKSF